MSLVNPYIGIPKCQDCGWKLYTDLTNNCSCMGEITPERELKHKVAFNRARELQTMSDPNLPFPENNLPFPENNLPFPENNLPEVVRFFPEVPTETLPTQVAPEPQLYVPEEFPLTVDCGVIPWSKIPIAEVSPLVWFRYERTVCVFAEGHGESVSFAVWDGNGRRLFSVFEEEVAKFFVTAANLYVQAGMQTQTEV